MQTIYSPIKTEQQYYEYCKQLAAIVNVTNHQQDIDRLTLLIEKWDEEHNTFTDADPIQLLQYLMEVNNLKPIDMALLLSISLQQFADILNYSTKLSNDIINKLCSRFCVSPKLFNKPYNIVAATNTILIPISTSPNYRKHI